MRVLICGDRYWTNAQAVCDRVTQLPEGTVVVHGASRGADTLAGKAATARGLTVEEFPADWEKLGRAAGPVRNDKMLDTQPDLVIAFHAHLDRSKGTKHCVEEARRRGIEVEVISA